MRQVVGGSDVVPMSWRRAESLLNPAGKGCCVRSGAGVGLTDIDLGSPDRQTKRPPKGPSITNWQEEEEEEDGANEGRSQIGSDGKEGKEGGEGWQASSGR